MKLLLENWRKFTESIEDPELWGNCGMVAVAIAEEAKSRGLDPMLVLVHNADDEDTIMMGDYDLYHVAVTIGDNYYDDRGEISRDELNFDDFGEEDRDYYVDEFFLNEKVKDAIKRNTNWDKCPTDFKERALEILDNDEDELTPNQKEFPERYGNCGMLALALIEEGIKRKIPGIEIVFVTATDEDEFLEADEPEIHHVAMWFKGKYYDDRGEISEDQLGDFSPLGLTSPKDAKPKEGRDYIVLAYEMENNKDLKLATDIVKNNTDWWKSCEEYTQRAEDFWEKVNNETPT